MNTEGKTGATPSFPAGKWGVVPAFPGNRTRGNNRELSPLFSHLVYSYPGAMRPVVIPKYQEVPAFIIKNNMKVIGMTRDQYFQFLENI